ncbi:MAG: hypothetical protein L6Q71_04830 [Planctomycetes bacterium]|nr:hypothetical protein [Planctomycetota bacterium]
MSKVAQQVCLWLLLLGAGLGFAPPGHVVTAEKSDDIRKEITRLQEKLSELEKKRDDEEKKEHSNLEEQKTAAKEALEDLKKSAADIAKRLNTIRDDIKKIMLGIDEQWAKLRDVARGGASKAVKKANEAAGKGNKRDTTDALKDAKREINDWDDAFKSMTIREHTESAKLRDATSTVENAEAKSELNSLNTTLALLRAEKKRLSDETVLLEELTKAQAAAKLVPDDWKDVSAALSALAGRVKGRTTDVDQRIENGGKRVEAIERFIGKK